jgi:hypothetical protein
MKAYSGSKGKHLQLHTFLTSTLDENKAPQYVHKRKYTRPQEKYGIRSPRQFSLNS